MSRQITTDACSAFEEERYFKNSNTEVEVGIRVADQRSTVTLLLHGNAIAKSVDDCLYIRTAGWNTATTRERLNGLDGVDVYMQKKVLHLNGQPWENHDDWTMVQKGQQS